MDNPTTVSSGNVFTDLGLPDADELKMKVWLAVSINRVVAQLGLLEIPAVADYKLSGFTVGELKDILVDLVEKYR